MSNSAASCPPDRGGTTTNSPATSSATDLALPTPMIAATAQYAALYDTTYMIIYSYIRRRVRDHLLAEDLTQDVYIKGWKAWLSFLAKKQEENAALRWLQRIAYHTIIDHHRRSRPTEELRDECPDSIDAFAAVQCPSRILDALSSRQKRLLHLMFEERCSLTEAASAMDISYNAAKSLRKRTIACLRAANYAE